MWPIPTSLFKWRERRRGRLADGGPQSPVGQVGAGNTGWECRGGWGGPGGPGASIHGGPTVGSRSPASGVHTAWVGPPRPAAPPVPTGSRPSSALRPALTCPPLLCSPVEATFHSVSAHSCLHPPGAGPCPSVLHTTFRRSSKKANLVRLLPAWHSPAWHRLQEKMQGPGVAHAVVQLPRP